MKVAALYAVSKEFDHVLAEAFAAGARAHGEDAEAVATTRGEDLVKCDVVMLFGVKSRADYEAYRAAGVHTVVVDKGYIRSHVEGSKLCEYWRVSVDSHHPTRYLYKMQSPPDRWSKFGIDIKPWRKQGRDIIFAGSSEKFHNFNGLEHPTAYATGVIRKLSRLTPRPIVYRPKPSWRDAVPIPGSTMSPPKHRLSVALESAWALVTNGSNACFEAVIAGVPVIVLGDAVAKPLSSTRLEDVEAPYLAWNGRRRQWLQDLAYCQWTIGELESGEAWPHIRRYLAGE